MLFKNKPIQTIDGRRVRILCWDAKTGDEYPIIGLVQEEDGLESLHCWKTDGEVSGYAFDPPVNIINVPENIENSANMNGNNYKKEDMEMIPLPILFLNTLSTEELRTLSISQILTEYTKFLRENSFLE